jgi:hypothetical protein
MGHTGQAGIMKLIGGISRTMIIGVLNRAVSVIMMAG